MCREAQTKPQFRLIPGSGGQEGEKLENCQWRKQSPVSERGREEFRAGSF